MCSTHRRRGTLMLAVVAASTIVSGCRREPSGEAQQGSQASQARETTASRRLPEDELLALAGDSGGVVLAVPTDCYSLPQQEGIARIRGAAGDAANVVVRCGRQVVGRCTATIAAGQNTARCNTGKLAVDQVGGQFSCTGRILRGNPVFVAGCQDP
jgi:outer membrane murein-binding lipoprotein Lpp